MTLQNWNTCVETTINDGLPVMAYGMVCPPDDHAGFLSDHVEDLQITYLSGCYYKNDLSDTDESRIARELMEAWRCEY